MTRRNGVQRWDTAGEGEVNKLVFDQVSQIERNQFDTFDRFEKLEALYDPLSISSSYSQAGNPQTDPCSVPIENVVASNIDTVTAVIAATEVRPRFMTDNADWRATRTAKRLEWYAEGLGKLTDLEVKSEIAFKEAAKKGTGLLKVYADPNGEVCVDHVHVEDIVVDEAECRGGGSPRQLHHRMCNVDADELAAQFPEHADDIMRARDRGNGGRRQWAGYRPLADDGVVVVESWKLPAGKQGSKGFRPGRHTICVEGADLLDEEWTKPGFPFAKIVWTPRAKGWYGISLAERIAGIQRALNRRNWHIHRNLDQIAVPTTYVRPADANLAVKTIGKLGTIAVVKGDVPETKFPQANSAETYQNRETLKAAAYEESGMSRLTATASKPAGLDSGVALREYRDSTTQRFAMQEKAYERFVLDAFILLVDVCKDLGSSAPVITRSAKFGAKSVKWKDVDMGDVRVQIAASSTLPRTPAGRYQTALEWAQAGVISTDEWRRLTEHPDLDRVLSLYTQGIDSVEKDIEAIEEGDYVVPEPFGNLQLMAKMGQMAYLRDRDLGAPEEVLEGLRQYVVLAQHLLNPPAPPAPPPMPGAPGMDPSMGMPPPTTAGLPPDMGASLPPAGPQAALAPTAMNLVAGHG